MLPPTPTVLSQAQRYLYPVLLQYHMWEPRWDNMPLKCCRTHAFGNALFYTHHKIRLDWLVRGKRSSPYSSSGVTTTAVAITTLHAAVPLEALWYVVFVPSLERGRMPRDMASSKSFFDRILTKQT